MVVASVNLMPDGPPQRVAALAARAEALGFSRCWVYDEGLAARDVYVTLTAIAAATEHLRFGPGITNPHTRHPATTAAAIATLDELSGARAFLGLGAGGSLTLGPMGIRSVRPLTAVRETVEALRMLWSGRVGDYAGEHLRLRAASLPYARPDLEIWLAGRGPRMMTLAGEIADGFNLSYLHKATLGDAVSRLRAAGRPLRVSYSTMLITDTARGLADARTHLTYRLVDSPADVRARLGIDDRRVADIRAALATGGPAAAAELIEEAWVEPFVIFGTPAQCRAELADLLTRHGIDEFQAPILHLDGAAAELDRIAEIVSP